MSLILAALVAVVLIVTLFVFAYRMDKHRGVILFAVLVVWLYNMQPASAATIKTVTDVDGVRYYDVMTTNPNESYNGVQGRDPRIDKLYKWLDAECRGGHGDDPDTQAFCNLRDKLAKQ